MIGGSGDGSTPRELPRLRWPEDAPSDETAEILRALGHPVRLRILWLLAHGGEFGIEDDPCCERGVLCVCRIRAFFDISSPNLSHHLKVLRHAGLVDTRRVGIWTHYHLRQQRLEVVLDVLNSLHGEEETQPARAISVDGRVAAGAGTERDDGPGPPR